MKVNDVLQKGELALRILVIKDDFCLCINCNAESMPAWMPANLLEDYTPDAAPVIDTNMTARQKQAAHGKDQAAAKRNAADGAPDSTKGSADEILC